jgi:hypothetical protein
MVSMSCKSLGSDTIAMALYTTGSCCVEKMRVARSGTGERLRQMRTGTLVLFVIRCTNATLFAIFSTVRGVPFERETNMPSSAHQSVAISPSHTGRSVGIASMASFGLLVRAQSTLRAHGEFVQFGYA